MYRRSVFYRKIAVFPKSRAEENTRKMPLLRDGRIFTAKNEQEDTDHENRADKAGKDNRYLV